MPIVLHAAPPSKLPPPSDPPSSVSAHETHDAHAPGEDEVSVPFDPLDPTVAAPGTKPWDVNVPVPPEPPGPPVAPSPGEMVVQLDAGVPIVPIAPGPAFCAT